MGLASIYTLTFYLEMPRQRNLYASLNMMAKSHSRAHVTETICPYCSTVTPYVPIPSSPSSSTVSPWPLLAPFSNPSKKVLAFSHSSASISLPTLPLLLFNHPISSLPIPPSARVAWASGPVLPNSFTSLSFFALSAGKISASSSPSICLRSPTSSDCRVLKYDSEADWNACLRSSMGVSGVYCEAERALRASPADLRSSVMLFRVLAA